MELMDKHCLRVNGLVVEFNKHEGNGSLIVSVLDENGGVMQDTELNKTKIESLVEFLNSIKSDVY